MDASRENHPGDAEVRIMADGTEPDRQPQPLAHQIADLPSLETLLLARSERTLSIGGEELFLLKARQVRLSEDAIMVFRYSDLRTLGAMPEVINAPAELAMSKAYFEPLGLKADDPRCREIVRLASNSFFTAAPDAHRAIKPVFARPLMPKFMAPVASAAERVANSLVDRLSGSGEIEFAEDFGQALAFGVWADLFGMSAEETARLQELMVGMAPIVTPGVIDAESFDLLSKTAPQYLDFLSSILKRAREEERAPFLQVMAQLYAGVGKTFSPAPESSEALTAASMIDGFDALGGSVASCAYALVAYPNIFETLVADPSLVPSAVEEALRLFGPVRTIARYANADFEHEGLFVPRGTWLLMNWGAGGRDPDVYDDPLMVDLARPRRGAAYFGAGPQICPGQNLVRTLCAEAIRALLRAGVKPKLVGEPVWSRVDPISFNAKLARLPLTIG